MASTTVQRRLLEPGLSSSLSTVCLSCRFTSLAITRPTRRYASSRLGKWAKAPENTANQHLGTYLNEAPKALMKPKEQKTPEKQKKTAVKKKKESEIATGTPAADSVFGDAGQMEGKASENSEEVQEFEEDDMPEELAPVHEEIDPEALMNVLDPEPGKTMAWQRKKLIQQIRKRGELTKEEMLKRTERECTVHSATFQTTTKKLVHLARQIAGKPIDEAIVQMQLSKKRVAQDIMKHLEYAKNMAIVSRGMGLGMVEGRAGEPIEIELKDGKRKLIKDQTGIYVDQAWVNKGEEAMTPEYRGRGRVFRITHRTAKMTVLLKEEATRVRLSQERQEKLNNRKLWLHLPDRPVTLQRQYPLW